MGLPVRRSEQHYTYGDYRRWPDDERWELIDGVAYSMSGPTTIHQTISMELGPPGRWVQQYVLGTDGAYAPEVTWVKTGTLVSPTLEGFELDIATIWPQE